MYETSVPANVNDLPQAILGLARLLESLDTKLGLILDAVKGPVQAEPSDSLPVTAEPPPVRPDILYTVEEVGAYLRCHAKTVYQIASESKIKTTRVGNGEGGIRVRGDDLIHFIELRRNSRKPKPTRKRKTVSEA